MKLKKAAIINSAIVAVMLFFSIWAWIKLPEGVEIPVHFNLQGQPDRYAGKFEGLLLMPLLAMGLTGLMMLIPRIEPRQEHRSDSSAANAITVVTGVLFLAVVHYSIIAIAVGKTVDIVTIVMIMMGILFIVMGNYLSKTRSNFFFGIRTPWTLSSELAWRKTNRLGAWLFVFYGVSFIIGAIIGNSWLLIGLIGTLLIVSLVILPIYSYRISKKDSADRGEQ